ncbi:MAG: hypothetical protein C0410_06300 [Anaerolinea sp.]|nr:hypothetical protein [Anaerolinea sp.]
MPSQKPSRLYYSKTFIDDRYILAGYESEQNFTIIYSIKVFIVTKAKVIVVNSSRKWKKRKK